MQLPMPVEPAPESDLTRLARAIGQLGNHIESMRERMRLLEAVIEGNIVADFPLCNKSFNCSYSGQDL